MCASLQHFSLSHTHTRARAHAHAHTHTHTVNCNLIFFMSGLPGGAVGRGTALQTGRQRVQFPVVSLEFFIDIILPAALWLWDRLNL